MEAAARLILGDLDEPERNFMDLLDELRLKASRNYLSGGEKVLVDLALQFWNGSGEVTVAGALRALDAPNRARLLLALELVAA